MKAVTMAPPLWCSPLPRAPVSIRDSGGGSGEDDSGGGEDYCSSCEGGMVTAVLTPQSAVDPFTQLRAQLAAHRPSAAIHGRHLRT